MIGAEAGPLPPGPTIRAVKTFDPLTSFTAGMVKAAVSGIGMPSWMRVGAWPWSVW